MKFRERFWSHVNRTKGRGCWEWQGSCNDEGYGRFQFGRHYFSAHRLAYELEIDHVSRGFFVCHKCDNPKCCRPSHLFIGTNITNALDKMKKGRHRPVQGEKHPRAVLTGKMVKTIRKNNFRSHRSLARLYGVSKTTIGRIKRGESWLHLK